MCFVLTVPVALAISSAISAAATLNTAHEQQKAANKQAKAMSEQAQAEQNALGLQQQQQSFASAEEMNERAKQAHAEAAQFDVIAGEYGDGTSIERQAAAITFNRDHDLASIKNNRDAVLSQIGQEGKGADARLNAGLASIRRPSQLGTALTIAGTAANAYMQGQRPQPKPNPWLTIRSSTT